MLAATTNMARSNEGGIRTQSKESANAILLERPKQVRTAAGMAARM
jgi:hypothetical protein